MHKNKIEKLDIYANEIKLLLEKEKQFAIGTQWEANKVITELDEWKLIN